MLLLLHSTFVGFITRWVSGHSECCQRTVIEAMHYICIDQEVSLCALESDRALVQGFLGAYLHVPLLRRLSVSSLSVRSC